MGNLISKLADQRQLMELSIIFLSFLVGAIVAVTAIVMHQIRRMRQTELEAALKQQMLDKGMSAADIVQVLKASKEPTAEEAEGAKDFTAIRSELVQSLVEHEMPAADIELVLQSLQERPDGAKEKAEMVANMAEQGLTGADIARVVRAMDSPTADAAIPSAQDLTTAPPMTA